MQIYVRNDITHCIGQHREDTLKERYVNIPLYYKDTESRTNLKGCHSN